MNIYLDNIFFLSFFITLCTYTEPYENITDLKYVQGRNIKGRISIILNLYKCFYKYLKNIYMK
ncbi:hypothetical protein PFFCH_02508 [Plasmodium falciparum FCH/4]|uniref:Plasmodium falciparum erythrocyte membrane protein 1 acidic terminal segment domain-containing protein n=1 Tax=Plasmodium falciparum FCH/4 TaxID=1036724 RepID=A0A024VNK7_PLAFA|nr:hypothetical protein PFFCH_02508 [Plasmodium falciparum FCH/4]